MEILTEEELKSLTIEKLNQMTELQLNEVANQVIDILDDDDIKNLPREVKAKLKIRKNGLFTWSTLIALIIFALAKTLVQEIMK